jgi:hypothetical protein
MEFNSIPKGEDAFFGFFHVRLCYWAARELGISTLELAKRLCISQPTDSQSVKRGKRS